jgi:RES domain-containing protein
VTAQISDRVLTCYRIGDPDGQYPVFDATGSRIVPGRWNTPDTPLIYTSEHYSTAMLEKLVHGSGMLPPNQHFVTVTVPSGISYEVFPTAHFPAAVADPDGAFGRGPDGAEHSDQPFASRV